MKTTLSFCFTLLLLGYNDIAEASRRITMFNMKEFETIDNDIHSYESIVDEDIWKYKVADEMGVRNLTAEMYMEEVYPMKKGDKPWYICMINKSMGPSYSHSTFLMKSLYFLQRDYSHKANYAYVDARNEFIREVFDYEIIPMCVYI